MRNGDIKSAKTFSISCIHKEFQTTRQVTTILGELLKIFPKYEFEKLEHQHQSYHYTKCYTGWQQLITLLYAQIAGHDSLREATMKNRPYYIYEGLFYTLLDKCRTVTPAHKFRFKSPLFSMDATVIDFCLKGNRLKTALLPLCS